jgi:hypothetical protein
MIDEAMVREASLSKRIRELETLITQERENNELELRYMKSTLEHSEKQLQFELQRHQAEKKAHKKADKIIKSLTVELQESEEKRKNFEKDMNYSKATLENELMSIKIRREADTKRIAELEKLHSDLKVF